MHANLANMAKSHQIHAVIRPRKAIPKPPWRFDLFVTVYKPLKPLSSVGDFPDAPSTQWLIFHVWNPHPQLAKDATSQAI